MRHLARGLPPPNPDLDADCIHCRASSAKDKLDGKAFDRKPSEDLDFEFALQKAWFLVALDWQPARLADIEEMDKVVFDLFFEMRTGQRHGEDDKKPAETTGRPIHQNNQPVSG